MMSVALYTKFANFSSGLSSIPNNQTLNSWMVAHYTDFILPPVVLMVLIISSGKLAKALVGQ